MAAIEQPTTVPVPAFVLIDSLSLCDADHALTRDADRVRATRFRRVPSAISHRRQSEAVAAACPLSRSLRRARARTGADPSEVAADASQPTEGCRARSCRRRAL